MSFFNIVENLGVITVTVGDPSQLLSLPSGFSFGPRRFFLAAAWIKEPDDDDKWFESQIVVHTPTGELMSFPAGSFHFKNPVHRVVADPFVFASTDFGAYRIEAMVRPKRDGNVEWTASQSFHILVQDGASRLNSSKDPTSPSKN